MTIRVLEPQVAAQIAAGEVVERPASVVKELVENALDAGATQVIVEAQGGGIEYLRVTDNGCGISAAEVELAFQRHATSKLATAADLESIATLGFRGEALPSIAAVARVSLVTRTGDSPRGHAIELEGGRVLSQGARGCPPGTSVTVRELFGSVPARRKFLKSPSAEAGRIADLLSRMALAYPHVRFRLVGDGREALSTSGSGSLQDTIAGLYGAEVAGQLLPLAWEGEGYRVDGYASPPSLTRANRSYITLFVNRRWVQVRLLTYALEQAYHGLLQQGRYPIAVVHLALPYDQVDVNVHPTKREVRFRREDVAFAAVQRAVRAALVARSPVPELPAETLARPREGGGSERGLAPSAGAPALALASPAYQPRLAATEPPAPQPTPKELLPRLRVLGQMGATYIVAEGPDGLYLIDQHAAHERVLFERVRQAVDVHSPEVQALLEPAPVELSPEQAALARESFDLLRQYGFLLEPFGESAYLLRGVPAVVRSSDPAMALREVLDLMAHEGRLVEREEKLAASIACHSAVRAGMEMAQQAMAELVAQLEASSSPNTCPHGRPTMIRVSSRHLEREFGRR